MYTLDDLRRDLADETRDLAPRVTFEQVRARAMRRRAGGVIGVITAALLVPVVAAATFVALQPAGSTPGPVPVAIDPTIVPPEPDGSAGPVSGPMLSTGLPFGDRERLMLFFRDEMNGVKGALSDPSTGDFRELDDGAGAEPGKFSTVYELDDRHGGIVDYGVFGRADAQIEVTVGGKTVPANTGRLPQLPDATVFWVKRDGILANPTGAVEGADPDVTFTARDAAGSVLGTATEIQRSDGAVNRTDGAVRVGDWMPTGLTLAAGGELVFWFDGDEKAAMLHAGSDDGNGTVKGVKILGSYNRPPFDIGFYGGLNTFELAGGATVTVGTYAGRAATVTMEGTGASQQGSARWSAHPEARVFWAVGLTGMPSGVSRDAKGEVLGTTDFREPGGG